MSDQERGKKVNELAKICGQKAILPRSVCIGDLSEGSAEAVCSEGHAGIFKHTHNGIPVAVKVVNAYFTSDANDVLRVSPVPTSTASR